jgi:hypothetical protein
MCPIVSDATGKQPILLRMRPAALVIVTAALASTILLKVAEIQFLELIFLADLIFLIFIFAKEKMRVIVFRPYFNVALCYVIFMAAAILLSIYALGQDLFPYGPTSFLKRPLVMTLSRVAELLLDVFYMLYLADLYRKDLKLCLLGMKTYFWFGILSAIYSIATYPLNILYELNLGTYAGEHRMRGFLNEGGPYGVYLISMLLVTAVLRNRGWLTRAQARWGFVLFIFCMVMSQSKSAFAFLPVLALIDVYVLLPRIGKAICAGGLILIVVVAASLTDWGRLVEAYEGAASDYRALSQIRSEDGNYVMGRVAGTVLAPRMIAARPLTGVGWGNYGLVRDDPKYRQGTAFAIANDAPGLGPIDYVVELGIPLWIYLTWVEFRPFQYLRRRRADLLLLNLALMQPLANIFGAHLNITYPWVVGGFALGLGYHQYQQTETREAVVA